MYKFKAKRLDNGRIIVGGYEFLDGGHYIRIFRSVLVESETNSWENETFPHLVQPDTIEMIEGPELDRIKALEAENKKLKDPTKILVPKEDLEKLISDMKGEYRWGSGEKQGLFNTLIKHLTPEQTETTISEKTRKKSTPEQEGQSSECLVKIESKFVDAVVKVEDNNLTADDLFTPEQGGAA